MRNYFILGLLLICSQEICAQASKTRAEIDTYKHTINLPDYKAIFQLQSVDQVRETIDPDKKYHWYSANQIKITQGGFSGKLLNGIYNEFYLDNSLKEQGEFKMGLKVGEWKKWNTAGMLIERVNYTNGVPDGAFFTYNQYGKLAESGLYKNGKINGKLKKYLQGDSLIITRYKDGIAQIEKQSWIKKLLSKKVTFLSNKG